MSTLAPVGRTPAEGVAALWRLPEAPRPAAARPGPPPQRLWARWPHEHDGREVSATAQPWGWVAQAGARRHPEAAQPLLWLMAGPPSFWAAGQRGWPPVSPRARLALWQATPRRWAAAPLCSRHEEEPTLRLVDDRVLRRLTGEGPSGVAGLRQRGPQRQRRGTTRDQRAHLWGSLANPPPRRPDEVSLAAGSPMASGGIEGAWRHVMPDRRERSGMRWTIESAQARLAGRRPSRKGAWDDCRRYRIAQATQR